MDWIDYASLTPNAGLAYRLPSDKYNIVHHMKIYKLVQLIYYKQQW